MADWLTDLLGRVRQWLGRSSTVAEEPPHVEEPLATLTPRVLLIVYDPVVDRASGQRLSESQGWFRVEDLVADYIADVKECIAWWDAGTWTNFRPRPIAAFATTWRVIGPCWTSWPRRTTRIGRIIPGSWPSISCCSGRRTTSSTRCGCLARRTLAIVPLQ